MLDCACHLLQTDGRLATASERMVSGLRRLIASGVEQVVLTPVLDVESHHCRPQQEQAYRELRTLAGNAGLTIDLRLGAENHWNGEWSASRFLQTAAPLDDSGVVLIALPAGPLPASLWDFAFDLFRQGHTPMIAAAQEQPALLDDHRRRFERYFCRSGGLLQLDLASVIGSSWSAATRNANRFLKQYPDNCLIASGRSFERLTDRSWQRVPTRHRRRIPPGLTALPERRARIRDPADLPPRPTRQWTATDGTSSSRQPTQRGDGAAFGPPATPTPPLAEAPSGAASSAKRPLSRTATHYRHSSPRDPNAPASASTPTASRSISSRRQRSPSERLSALAEEELDDDPFVVLAIDEDETFDDADRTSIRALTAAGEAALRAGDPTAAVTAYDRVLVMLDDDLVSQIDEHDRLLACNRILTRRATALVQLDRRREAFRDLTRARRLSQNAEDASGTIHALLAMSEILQRSQQCAPADDLAREALAVARTLGDPLRLTVCLAQHGRLAAQMQQWELVEEVLSELGAHAHQFETALACVQLAEALASGSDLDEDLDARLLRWEALLEHDGIQRHSGLVLHCRYRRACLLAENAAQLDSAINELESILIAFKQVAQQHPELPLPEPFPAMHLTLATYLLRAERRADTLARLQLARFEYQHMREEDDHDATTIALRICLDLARIHGQMDDTTSEQRFMQEALGLAEQLDAREWASNIRRALDGAAGIPTLGPDPDTAPTDPLLDAHSDPITATSLSRARQPADPDPS